MAIKSISDLLGYSLFIFDLDNTIYNEEEYLFQGYMAIAGRFDGIVAGYDREKLFNMLTGLYRENGREKLFDRFLEKISLDKSYITDCLNILRNFNAGEPLVMFKEAGELLRLLADREKKIFILTNGNSDQQRNKIRSIQWNGLDKHIRFIYADEIEPKPSAAGVLYILRITGTETTEAIFIGDKETDRVCAENGGISYLDIRSLPQLFNDAGKN